MEQGTALLFMGISFRIAKNIVLKKVNEVPEYPKGIMLRVLTPKLLFKFCIKTYSLVTEESPLLLYQNAKKKLRLFILTHIEDGFSYLRVVHLKVLDPMDYQK